MSEHQDYRTLINLLKPLGARRLEHKFERGWPDIIYVGGVIECKRLAKWPKAADVKPVKLSHPLMKQQELWLKAWVRSGGTAHVCLHIGRDWFFFTPDVDVNNLTRPQMKEKAAAHWDKKPTRSEIVSFLRACKTCV